MSVAQGLDSGTVMSDAASITRVVAMQPLMKLFEDGDDMDASSGDEIASGSLDSGDDDSDGSLGEQDDDFLAGGEDSGGKKDAGDDGCDGDKEPLTAFERKSKEQEQRTLQTRALADAEAAAMLETNIADVRTWSWLDRAPSP
jgi:hypothetical protein